MPSPHFSHQSTAAAEMAPSTAFRDPQAGAPGSPLRRFVTNTYASSGLASSLTEHFIENE